MEVRRPRIVETLACVVYPLDEPQLAAMTPSHIRRAQLVCRLYLVSASQRPASTPSQHVTHTLDAKQQSPHAVDAVICAQEQNP